MNWSKGYSATYYAKKVDPATWRDLGTIRLTGGSIRRESTGLRESANIDCEKYEIGIEQWIRVYLDVNQGGDTEHVALFTGLATSPQDEYVGRMSSNKLECYSVLKPADDIPLMRGWYAAAGLRSGDVIAELLEATPAPTVIDGEPPRLSTAIIAEDNETRLSMVGRILTAIDWRMWIDGEGIIHVGPKPLEPAATFDPLENDVIETKVSIKCDWYACPNVFLAINKDVTGIARDDSPDSPLSIVSRGREVWRTESNCDLAENESIAQYARRRLKEEQQAQKTAQYDRRYVPGIAPGGMVRLRYPEQGLEGEYIVESQTITLGHGAQTSERIKSYEGN